jgi:hypothetical protein
MQLTKSYCKGYHLLLGVLDCSSGTNLTSVAVPDPLPAAAAHYLFGARSRGTADLLNRRGYFGVA